MYYPKIITTIRSESLEDKHDYFSKFVAEVNNSSHTKYNSKDGYLEFKIKSLESSDYENYF
jgi:hypothetical protein